MTNRLSYLGACKNKRHRWLLESCNLLVQVIVTFRCLYESVTPETRVLICYSGTSVCLID